MKCTNLLMKDHKIILRALDVLQHMATRVENDRPVEAGDIERIIGFLRAFADDHHQAKEESALFPELIQTSAGNDSRLRRMIFEHDQERSLVEGLEDAARTRKGREFVHFSRRLVALIRSHIDKEDNIVFPIADEALSPEQDERVTEQLNRFQIDDNYLADLRRLEWKYVRRDAA